MTSSSHAPPVAPVGYREALSGVALIERTTRHFFHLTGRAPAQMLGGLSTGRIPPEFVPGPAGLLRGSVPYSALLTPRGRLVADLRVARMTEGAGGTLLLELPADGVEEAIAHLRQYLPPRFATLTDPPLPLAILTVIGPAAASSLGPLLAPGGKLDPGAMESLPEGAELVAGTESEGAVRVIRNDDVHPPAFDVILPAQQAGRWVGELLAAGATLGDGTLWDTLRVERGRPEFGRELDRATLLPEAGIEIRVVDSRKGCYTGQEVMVRIRDRGRVNRHLRGLLLGESLPPPAGTPLHSPGKDPPVGEVRTAVSSPLFGQTVALGFVRREVEPPACLTLGAPEGPEAEVRELDARGWVLVAGDPSGVS